MDIGLDLGHKMTFGVFLFVMFLGVCGSRVEAIPKWAPSYIVHGTLRLPYAEIKEPFYAYYDADSKRSRVDYYGGVVKTVQIGGKKKNYGKTFKVTPVTTEKVLNDNRCFVVNGTKDSIVDIQAVLPNTTDFKLVHKNMSCDNVACQLWQNIVTVGQRTSTYSLWVTVSKDSPIRYEMLGYDNLLGSHYDKYYITYEDYLPQVIEDKIFDINIVAKDIQCLGFPPNLVDYHRLLMNPMAEYINGHTSHLEPMFKHYKHHHGKTYSDKENHQRQINFMHNLRFIDSHNRAGHTYSVAVNHLADWTDSERKALCGNRQTKQDRPNHALAFNKTKYALKDMPDQLDWRLYGAVTPVKDQAVCGSCWSFGTTGAVEGALFLKTGKLVRLSQQELIDCSWGEKNNGCDGGDDINAYEWIKQHGLASEETYGDYLGQNSYCQSANKSVTVKTLRGYVNVTSGDAQALKLAIANHGPISVAIDAAVRSFSFYAKGVYYEPNCGSKPDDLDHAVLAVGYGAINGQGYWLVKNSWSTYWGNDGYVLMSQKGNNCGVTTDPTYVLL